MGTQKEETLSASRMILSVLFDSSINHQYFPCVYRVSQYAIHPSIQNLLVKGGHLSTLNSTYLLSSKTPSIVTNRLSSLHVLRGTNDPSDGKVLF